EQGLNHVNNLAQEFGIGQHAALLNLPNFLPLSTLAWSNYMEKDTPRDIGKILLNARNEQHKKIIVSLNASSSEDIVAALPDSPLVFLSIAGQALAKLSKNFPQTANASANSPAAEKLKRLGVAARASQPGMSIL